MAFLPGLIVGAVAGAAVALLTSPRTGRENREVLMTHLPEASEEAPRLLERARTEIKQRLDSGLEAFQQGRDETRRKMTAELDEARRRESEQPPGSLPPHLDSAP